MPRGSFFNYATCHNIEPSLIIIMDDGNQYFEKKIIFVFQNLHNATCHILIYG